MLARGRPILEDGHVRLLDLSAGRRTGRGSQNGDANQMNQVRLLQTENPQTLDIFRLWTFIDS